MQWLWKLLGIDEDALREIRIEKYRQRVENARTRREALEAWNLMAHEIRSRSAAQIRRMERDRGIA